MRALSKKRCTGWGLAIAALGLLDAQCASGATRRLSLETPGAALSGGAIYEISGFSGPIQLPPTGTSAISYGFTIPDDFRSGSLTLEAQVGSPSASCDVMLRARYLYRARSGQARDAGAPDGGFVAVNASTPFQLLDGKKTLLVQTAPLAHSVSLVRFKIAPNGVEFPAFQAGDAINFTLERRGNNPLDTCTEALEWNAASIVYDAFSSRPPKGLISLDPHASLDGRNDETIVDNGKSAPLRLAKTTPPPFPPATGWSFVLPEDYKTGTPVDVEVLWESEASGCSIVVRPNYVFRSHSGFPRDHTLGSATDSANGLTFLSASTPVAGAAVSAPAAKRTGRLRFRIVATPGTFDKLQPGTAVQFGVFRAIADASDTCGDVGFSGASVVYTRGAAKNPRRSSLNAVAVAVEGPVLLSISGSDGNVQVGLGGVVSTGFVLPDDYKPNTAITLQLLIDSRSRNCTLVLAPASLNRSRVGSPRDFGAATGGLRALSASSPFILGGDVISFSTGPTDETISVRFAITTDADVTTLNPGDGIQFGLFRREGTDTCPTTFGIAGWSANYQRQ